MGEKDYTMTDFRGYPTSVPESKLKEWLAQQAELEKNPPPEEPPTPLSKESWDRILTSLADSGLLPREHAKLED